MSQPIPATVLNASAVVTGGTQGCNGPNKALYVFKPTNVTSFSAQWQGSIDGIHWANIGSAITGTGTVTDTTPYLWTRLDMTAFTPNTKTATTLTQTGGVATFTLTSHGFVQGDWVTIAGANESGYNRPVPIQPTVLNANTFTYPVDPATETPATGTITAKACITATQTSWGY